MAASTTARASGFSRSRYSVIPPPMSRPPDSTVSPACRSWMSCNRSPSPYRASSAGRSRRTPADPSTTPIATSPASTASPASGSIRGSSCRHSAATTQPAGTDSRPAATATLASARTGAASSRTALATRPASRESRDGHRSAIHCAVVPACELATSPRDSASAVIVYRAAPARAASRSITAAPRPGPGRSTGTPEPAGRPADRSRRTARRPAGRRSRPPQGPCRQR